MLIVFSASHRDFDLCAELIDWCKALGPYPNHEALLVTSTRISVEDSKALLTKLNEVGFSKSHCIRQIIAEEGAWPIAPNRMFQLAAEWVETKYRKHFFWLESDAAPLCEGWADRLEEEYLRQRHPFMGAPFEWISATAQRLHITGCMIYPPNIRRYNPYMLTATSEPWDVTHAELTLRHAHRTKLIFHDWGDRQTNAPPSYADQTSISRIPSDAVVTHRCKDGTLIQRLREIRGPGIQEQPQEPANHSKPAHINIISTVKHKIAAMINGAHAYSHAGNFGDVLYGLAAIKAAGGGDLIICPEQRKTAPCSIPISRQQYEFFAPLLKEQSYLRNVSYSEKYPTQDVHDLNTFRNAWVDHELKAKEHLDTLAKAHFYTLGIMHRFDDADTWLRVSDPIVTGKIVIARSPRYNSPTFPWKRLVQQRGKDLLFVGLEHEHARFEKDWGAKVSFWRVNDMLEMARLIAGARAFVGNQSSPLSLAIGMGQRVICEEYEKSADCRFLRDSYTGHLQVGPANIDFEAI